VAFGTKFAVELHERHLLLFSGLAAVDSVLLGYKTRLDIDDAVVPRDMCFTTRICRELFHQM